MMLRYQCMRMLLIASLLTTVLAALIAGIRWQVLLVRLIFSVGVSASIGYLAGIILERKLQFWQQERDSLFYSQPQSDQANYDDLSSSSELSTPERLDEAVDSTELSN